MADDFLKIDAGPTKMAKIGLSRGFKSCLFQIGRDFYLKITLGLKFLILNTKFSHKIFRSNRINYGFMCGK